MTDRPRTPRTPVPPPPSVADLLAVATQDRLAQVDFKTRLASEADEASSAPTPAHTSTRRMPAVAPVAVLSALPEAPAEKTVETERDEAERDEAVSEPAADTQDDTQAGTTPTETPTETTTADAPRRRPRPSRSATKAAARAPRATGATSPSAARPDPTHHVQTPVQTQPAEGPIAMSAVASFEHPFPTTQTEPLTVSVQQAVDQALERLQEAEDATLRHLAALEAEAQRRAELLTAQAELDAELIRLTARREAHAIVSAARSQAGEAPLPQQSAESRQLAEVSDAVSRFAESVEASIASLRPGGHRP